MTMSGTGLRGLGFFGVLLSLAACGGGPGAVATPAPPAEPVETGPTVEIVRTDTAGGQVVPPAVFGVDLDTIHAGPFDQGKMWTFEYPPKEYFASEYGFEPDDAWFETARLGALRIPGCSASFVSPNGLVMTNHHCAREYVTQVSKEGEHLLDNGFIARDLVDERAVEDFHADQLIEIVDVSDEVNARLDSVPEGERARARSEVLDGIKARLEEERGGEDAGIVVEMVSLYNGARTSAYVFRRYEHAKLVMAPELQIGFYGGDPDNFTYPRYNLDFSFLRLYDEEGKPLRTEHFFRVDDDGLREGEPVFIIGNPGSTSRLETVAQLEFRRDVRDRGIVNLLRTRMKILDDFIRRHPEEAEARDLRNSYFSLSNSEKAYSGQLRGLEDPVIMARRRDTERRFQAAVEADSALADRYGDLIERMAEIQEQKRAAAPAIQAFLAFGSPLLESATLTRALWAFQLISMAGAGQEQKDQILERIRGIHQQHPELDAGLMAARFQDLVKYLGSDDPAVQRILAGRTPEEAAREIVSGSVLADSAGAVAAAEEGALTPDDPAVQAIQAILPAFMEYNRVMGSAAPREQELAAEIGRARFEIYGTDVPPDATFSLRIADGVVKGYPYNGTEAPWHTTFYGMYDRHFSFEGREEWALPERWATPPAGLDLATSLNFVATADIIGGNSGSPVLDQELEVVGIVFDGNIESLPGDYIYLPELNRSVSVDVRGILAAMDTVYDVDRLVLELVTGKLVPTEKEADAVRR
ncbi:MAG: S46 family peptidase [Gemmatimonadota bacterium]